MKKSTAQKIRQSGPRHHCASCSVLPAGGVEVAAILLVLVFSLSAVLFTSVYANKLQANKVTALQTQLSESNGE